MKLDKKAVFSFLAITFGITYLIEGVIILLGFRAGVYDSNSFAFQMIVAAVMWVPALGAFITARYIVREPLKNLNIRFGNIKPYLFIAFFIPLIFIIGYSISSILGFMKPDWQMASFLEMMNHLNPDSQVKIENPSTALIILFFSSLLISPALNSLFGLGEEIGWRGFLLQKLLPLGKPKAYLLLGLIWGLWHLPLLLTGFFIPEKPFWAVIMMISLTTFFGVFMNEFTLYYRSTILAGFIHGVFNSQAYGIWRVLFPDGNMVLGGMTGVTSMLLWILAAILAVIYFKKKQKNNLTALI